MTITITMAYSGWIDYPTACALVLGENIGTTITAYLASINGNYHAKRAARAHMIINLIGVVWMIIAFKYFELKKVDLALIEVGLGGRLDCTNIVNPIITLISFP